MDKQHICVSSPTEYRFWEDLAPVSPDEGELWDEEWNTRLNAGGGYETHQQNTDRVRGYDHEGQFYSLNDQEGIVYCLDEDYNVIWEAEVGNKCDTLHVTQLGIVVQGTNSIYVLNREDGSREFVEPSNLPPNYAQDGLTADISRNRIYFHRGEDGDREQIYVLDMQGSISGEPQIDDVYNISNDRSWLGDGTVYGLFQWERNLYVFTREARIYEVEFDSKNIIEFFNGEPPLVDFDTNAQPAPNADGELETKNVIPLSFDLHLDSHGRLHICPEASWYYGGYYCVIDLETQTWVKNMEMPGDWRMAKREPLGRQQEDGKAACDEILGVNVTPTGYWLVVAAEAGSPAVTWGEYLKDKHGAPPEEYPMTRMEFYTHWDDRRKTTVYLPGINRNKTNPVEMAYPAYDLVPEAWENPPTTTDGQSNVFAWTNEGTIQEGISSAIVHEYDITTEHSDTASTSVTATSKQSNVVADADTYTESLVRVRKGILGGTDSNPTNTFYDYEDSVLTQTETYTKASSIRGDFYVPGTLVSVSASEVGATSTKTVFTHANSSLIKVTADINVTENVNREANTVSKSINIPVKVLNPTTENPEFARAMGVGDTTGLRDNV